MRRAGLHPRRHLLGQDIPEIALWDDILKLLYIGTPSDVEDGIVALNRGGFVGATFATSYPEYIEIMPAGVTKAALVERILELLELTPDYAMAIGNGDNDVEMLSSAGIAVCVANSSTRARRSAHVEVPSNDDDGVAIALEAFVLDDASARTQIRDL